LRKEEYMQKNEVRPILSLNILLQILDNLKTNETSQMKRNLLNTVIYALETLLEHEKVKGETR
jgi:hypothetical protein